LPNQWVETNQLFLENYLVIPAKEAFDISYADGAGICKAVGGFSANFNLFI
jgi:hypothetical protein